MKKIFVLFAIMHFTLGMLFAQRTGVMDIAGAACSYDTLVHRTIAPGATYTEYQFNQLKYGSYATTYKMRAHVFSVDMTNPYNQVSPCLNWDNLFHAVHQKKFVEKEKKAGKKPVATSSALFFQQIASTDGYYQANELCGHLVANNKVYSATNQIDAHYTVNASRLSTMVPVVLNSSAITNHGNFTITQINHCRDAANSSNAIALFCNGMTSWATNNGSGVEVRLKVTSNDGYIAVGENSCEVMEVVAGSGHSTSQGECYLSGAGEMATQLSALQKGDAVTINVAFVDGAGNDVHAAELNGGRIPSKYAVKNGSVVSWDKKNYAIVCVGASQDGKTSYIADLEISSYSNAPCECLAYLLKNIGAYDAIWMDGGPSAEMTLDGEWITINSIGGGFNGRYLPGCMMIYSTAPDDNVITKVEILDPTPKTVSMGDSYTLSLYGYNQYDEMIQKDAQFCSSVVITCDEAIGSVSNGIFYAKKEGEGSLYIQVQGQTEVKKVKMTVTDNRSLAIYPEKIFTGEGRPCQLKLYVDDTVNKYEVPVTDATWTTNAKYVLKGYNNGLIEPYVDGFAEVYAEYEGMTDTAYVTVENLEELVDYLDVTDLAGPADNLNLQLPSVPHHFSVSITHTGSENIYLRYQTGYNGDVHIATCNLERGGGTFTVTLDYDDIMTYPVKLLNVKGSNSSTAITQVIAYYTSELAIDEVQSAEKAQHIYYNIMGQQVENPDNGFYINSRKKIVFNQK